MSRVMRKSTYPSSQNKAQISFAVTAKLISALFSLNSLRSVNILTITYPLRNVLFIFIIPKLKG